MPEKMSWLEAGGRWRQGKPQAHSEIHSNRARMVIDAIEMGSL